MCPVKGMRYRFKALVLTYKLFRLNRGYKCAVVYFVCICVLFMSDHEGMSNKCAKAIPDVPF